MRVGDAEQVGAGFQVSAENAAGHQGILIVSDPTHTDFANYGTDPNYITHTLNGIDQSIAQWEANGGWYEYQFSWMAPLEGIGPITLFAGGNAINDAQAFYGEHYYEAYATMMPAAPADADGDTDVDLRDFAALQRCFGSADFAPESECAYLDADLDGAITLTDAAEWVTVLAGPTAVAPPEYFNANGVRGGVLYDKWWRELDLDAPTGTHPLYPPEGSHTGSATFRCKECHGWDYEGVEGVYGSGSHYTGITGVLNTTLTPSELYALLTADPAETPNGHNMDSYGFPEDALWDVVKMTIDGTLDMSEFISPEGTFYDNPGDGLWAYEATCAQCHGPDGTDINFHDPDDPEYVGTVAFYNPWEFMHKVRFGHPGAPMPRFELLGWPASEAAFIGAYAATLPTE